MKKKIVVTMSLACLVWMGAQKLKKPAVHKNQISPAIETATHLASQIRQTQPQIVGPLPRKEDFQAAYFQEVDRVFSNQMIAGLNADATRDALSNLNARGLEGAKALTDVLSRPPTTDSEVRKRISAVDYLIYRARWDENTSALLREYVALPLSQDAPVKYQAVMIAEKAEILGALAGQNWEINSSVLASLKGDTLRAAAGAEAVWGLVEKGLSLEEARRRVKGVVPEYKIL